MYNIDAKKNIESLLGEPYKKDENGNWTYGEYIAEIVLSHKTEGSMKKYLLATKLATAKGKVVVDTVEFVLIKEAIKEAKLFTQDSLNTLFNGQIEMYLESLKEDDISSSQK